MIYDHVTNTDSKETRARDQNNLFKPQSTENCYNENSVSFCAVGTPNPLLPVLHPRSRCLNLCIFIFSLPIKRLTDTLTEIKLTSKNSYKVKDCYNRKAWNHEDLEFQCHRKLLSPHYKSKRPPHTRKDMSVNEIGVFQSINLNW